MTYPLYIILRNDLLGMSPGRAAAQASHATSIFTEKMKDLETFPNPAFSNIIQSFKSWREEATYFGTTIVKSASFDEIMDLRVESTEIKTAKILSPYFDLIEDPEYLFRGPGEVFVANDVITGAVIFFPEDFDDEILPVYNKIVSLPLY